MWRVRDGEERLLLVAGGGGRCYLALQWLHLARRGIVRRVSS